MADQVIPQPVSQTVIIQTSSTDSANQQDHIKLLKDKVKKLETESKKVETQNANLRRTNGDLKDENKKLRSEVEDEENKIIELDNERKLKEDKIKELEDLLQLHHHNCVEEIQNLKNDMAHQAEMHRQSIEEEKAKGIQARREAQTARKGRK
ncbi:hypothetical protein V865_002227 [Kwoniella europaea PYCC6329]|uniref:BZIP domain-containing protein n=1 Tax=Kwoniella europaea PYCC6329 TaxID=1423913 RepID=A0AAX4KCF0_9TREE